MALSARTPTKPDTPLDDFLAIPPWERFHELLDGEIVRKVLPTTHHGTAQSRLLIALSAYEDDSLRGQPGGWRLMTEVEILLPERQVARPDLVGWRLERMPKLLDEVPVALRPDWVCEVISPSNPGRDTVIKYRNYARAGIPYYWLVDLSERSLTALRLAGEHYTVQAEAKAGDVIRAEPFELIEIAVGRLFA
jgi:Uma2 family endonuclease